MWLWSLLFLSFTAVKLSSYTLKAVSSTQGTNRVPFLSGWWDTAPLLKTPSPCPTSLLLSILTNNIWDQDREDPWLGIINQSPSQVFFTLSLTVKLPEPWVGPALMQATGGTEWLAGQGLGCVSTWWAFCSATLSLWHDRTAQAAEKDTHGRRAVLCGSDCGEWMIDPEVEK